MVLSGPAGVVTLSRGIRIDPIVAAGVEGRRRVDALVATDVSAAVKEARGIEHPWYRCQALTRVAAEVKGAAFAVTLLHEALAAAKKQDEPNRVVSVASWPISILVRRELEDVDGAVRELLRIIAPEPNPIRRGDALLMLLESVFTNPALRQLVLEPLLAALQESYGRKRNRLYQFTALIMAAESREAAERVYALMPPSREQRQTRKMLDAKEWTGPHWFVPYYEKRDV